MKKIIIISLLLLGLTNIHSQNITNTLGASGLFSVKDGSTTLLSLNQANGFFSLNNSLELPYTTSPSIGVIYKGTDRFIHNFERAGSLGGNTFIGINSGNFTLGLFASDGIYNTAVGHSSLTSLTLGQGNSALGYLSLTLNTTGSYNSAFGLQSLSSNTTGNSNSAFGFQSLYTNITGIGNSAFGSAALNENTGSNNSAFGTSSLSSNTTAGHNSAFGNISLASNTTGSFNSAFGSGSLSFSTTGNSNSAFGMTSLLSNTTGDYNSAFGYAALLTNSTGYSNSAFGWNTLYNSEGVGNTAFGTEALYSKTTGDYNTALGYFSGHDIITGNNNITIGYNAQVPNNSESNQIRFGNNAITYAGVQVAWTITSDRRWKDNIQSTNLGLEFITKLNPVEYSRKNHMNHKKEYGLIAQDVEKVLKQEGAKNYGMITVTSEGMYELRYNDLIAPMIKAIQELKQENDELKSEIENLKNEQLTEIQNLKEDLVEQIKLMKLQSEDNDLRFSALQIKGE